MENSSAISIQPLQYKCECNQVIPIYTQLQAKRCGCGSCGKYYRIERGELKLVHGKRGTETQPHIAIGSKGVVEDDNYIVTGYVVKKDQAYNYSWREYTLYNPTFGYIYLSEYNGHWMLLKPTNFISPVGVHDMEKTYNGETYKLYSKYRTKTVNAIGEFVNSPYEDENKCHEFINPPQILVHEFKKEETMWLHGEYLEPKEVQAIFGLADMPARSGVGVIQPVPMGMPFKDVLRLSAVAAIALFILQALFYSMAEDKVVYQYAGSLGDFERGKIVSPSFDLTQASKNVEVIVTGDVNNNWFEADLTLINEKTDEDLDLEMGVEYYQGYTDGESWSEGSRKAAKIIDAVPAGRYHLLITPVKDALYSYIHYTIEIRRDVPIWGNFLFGIFLLALLPIIQYFRERSFETSRWMDSNYSPYDTE